MMNAGCPDCWKEQRSRADILKQTRIDAQKLSTEKEIKVAIFQDGQGFAFEGFTTAIPAGTIEIIMPSE